MKFKRLWWLCLLSTSAFAGGTMLKNGDFSVEINGAKIAYMVRGQGPVCMVLTNSWGFTAEGLHRLLGDLEDQFTMVYFDPRGMGRSGPATTDTHRSLSAVRKDMHRLREHLGLEKTHVLGWSNGAMNAFYYVTDYPQHVDRAVFLHGIAGFDEEGMAQMREKNGPWLMKQANFMKELREGPESDKEKTGKLRRFIIEEWFPQLCADPEKGMIQIREMMNDLPFSWPHMRRQAWDMATYDARPLLRKIRHPSLVAAGAHDVLPASSVKLAADGINGSTFHIFENSGHFAPMEEPEQFKSVVTSFLKGH